MNSPETKQKYVTRLKEFFDFISINQNTIEELFREFLDKSKIDPNSRYALNAVIRFFQMNKDRVKRKEITEATARNYVKTLRLFCK